MALQDKILEGGKLLRTLFYYRSKGISWGVFVLLLLLIAQTGRGD